MQEFLISSSLLITEAAALTLLLLLIAAFLLFRRGRRNRAKAREFATEFRTGGEARCNELQTLLSDICNLDESNAAQAARSLFEHRKNLCKQAMMLSLGRDGASLGAVDDEVVALIRGCLENSNAAAGGNAGTTDGALDGMAAGAVGSGNVRELRAQVSKLIQDKRELELQLQQSKDNMERVMTEYASMYAGSQKDAKTKLERESARLRDKK